MNIEELKALAEKALPWGMDVSQKLTGDDGDNGFAAVGSLHDDGEFAEVMVIDTANYNAPGEARKLADYYAAANPAAIIALISALEQAQDERRALLATEQNLRERVKALENGLKTIKNWRAPDGSLLDGPKEIARALLEKTT